MLTKHIKQRLKNITGSTVIFKPKWIHYYLKLAVTVSEQSRDPSTKCGAILVNNNKDIVATGFNGFPERVEDNDEWLNDREFKYAAIIHAEMNAILRCPVPTRGLHMFMTAPPCSNCAKHIIAAGISSIYWLKPPVEFAKRWEVELNRSKILYEVAKLPFFELDSAAISR
jgi:dCMP deaminase